MGMKRLPPPEEMREVDRPGIYSPPPQLFVHFCVLMGEHWTSSISRGGVVRAERECVKIKKRKLMNGSRSLWK